MRENGNALRKEEDVTVGLQHGNVELEFMDQVHANMNCASVFKGPHV